MGRGWGPPAYLAPLPYDTPKTKEHWEPLLLSPNLRGTNPNWTNFLCRTLLYIYYPFAADDASFELEDGGLVNELTLWMFDSGYWWSTSEPVLTQRVFCSGLFPVSTLCSSPCLSLPSSQSTRKMSPWGHAFHFSVFLSPLVHRFLYFDSMFL